MIQAGELADRRVAVGVGRARHRQGRGQLGVAEAGEGADESGDDVGDEDRRAGVERRGVAGAHEDARADDAADAEEDEVPGAERPLELAGLGLALDLGNGLAQEDSPEEPPRCGTGHGTIPSIWPCFCAEPSGNSGGASPNSPRRPQRRAGPRHQADMTWEANRGACSARFPSRRRWRRRLVVRSGRARRERVIPALWRALTTIASPSAVASVAVGDG